MSRKITLEFFTSDKLPAEGSRVIFHAEYRGWFMGTYRPEKDWYSFQSDHEGASFKPKQIIEWAYLPDPERSDER
jgi:hypothetical protein